ncbi:hypothetical protein BD626DRAFT_265387 [Schizophyllum amplum]|uniref:Uncharacterized protein n=1 Tax=Schizophyllum amplum TaxID=97359 RepID=A0A550CH23_9AGAR|nr:hypothetical protein BD626DRAFT_265387 [Auriculariopsis ampla]
MTHSWGSGDVLNKRDNEDAGAGAFQKHSEKNFRTMTSDSSNFSSNPERTFERGVERRRRQRLFRSAPGREQCKRICRRTSPAGARVVDDSAERNSRGADTRGCPLGALLVVDRRLFDDNSWSAQCSLAPARSSCRLPCPHQRVPEIDRAWSA